MHLLGTETCRCLTSCQPHLEVDKACERLTGSSLHDSPMGCWMVQYVRWTRMQNEERVWRFDGSTMVRGKWLAFMLDVYCRPGISRWLVIYRPLIDQLGGCMEIPIYSSVPPTPSFLRPSGRQEDLGWLKNNEYKPVLIRRQDMFRPLMQVTASHGRTDPCSLCGGMLRLWNVPPGFHLLHPFALIQAVGILKEKTTAANVNNKQYSQVKAGSGLSGLSMSEGACTSLFLASWWCHGCGGGCFCCCWSCRRFLFSPLIISTRAVEQSSSWAVEQSFEPSPLAARPEIRSTQ